ncbi:MAG: pantetheine-phosphate adenylyltransferase [Gammaproteobacteria bacterium]|nr:MAG: pantetheine-phosphate adenylyltransferase [Gammaproteobacteria bacterium]
MCSPVTTALFPGTFDPVTFGHLDIIERALPLFDKLYVGIGINSNKQPMFSADIRVQWLNEIFKNEKRVEAVIYEGLTVECCKKVGANYIIRGIRYVNDFEYEKAIADMNRSLDEQIETICVHISNVFVGFADGDPVTFFDIFFCLRF